MEMNGDIRWVGGNLKAFIRCCTFIYSYGPKNFLCMTNFGGQKFNNNNNTRKSCTHFYFQVESNERMTHNTKRALFFFFFCVQPLPFCFCFVGKCDWEFEVKKIHCISSWGFRIPNTNVQSVLKTNPFYALWRYQLQW